MGELPRMNGKQYRRARKLIRRLCANYDNGNCLLLDDGEVCPCPQLITPVLICRYFRAAVLPSDRELCMEIMMAGTKFCPDCGRQFMPGAKNTRYCDACAVRRKLRSKRQWAAKNRLRGRKN